MPQARCRSRHSHFHTSSCAVRILFGEDMSVEIEADIVCRQPVLEGSSRDDGPIEPDARDVELSSAENAMPENGSSSSLLAQDTKFIGKGTDSTQRTEESRKNGSAVEQSALSRFLRLSRSFSRTGSTRLAIKARTMSMSPPELLEDEASSDVHKQCGQTNPSSRVKRLSSAAKLLLRKQRMGLSTVDVSNFSHDDTSAMSASSTRSSCTVLPLDAETFKKRSILSLLKKTEQEEQKISRVCDRSFPCLSACIGLCACTYVSAPSPAIMYPFIYQCLLLWMCECA